MYLTSLILISVYLPAASENIRPTRKKAINWCLSRADELCPALHQKRNKDWLETTKYSDQLGPPAEGRRAVRRETAMGRPLRACNSPGSPRPSATWTRTCLTSAALIFATAGGVVLAISCVTGLLDDSWLRGRRQHLANTLTDQHGGGVGAATAGTWTGGLYARRGMQEQKWEESWRHDNKSVSASSH